MSNSLSIFFFFFQLNFPSLKHTVIIGHGDGADALNRYAFASSEARQKDVQVTLLNPSSSVYLDGTRYNATNSSWLPPSAAELKVGRYRDTLHQNKKKKRRKGMQTRNILD